jgi:hypothetical protein
MPATRTGRASADDPVIVGRVPRGSRAPSKSRSSVYGFLDPDDPDAEMVIRQHAEATGQDPDEAVRSETARRASRGRSGSLDDVLADERAKASRQPPGAAGGGAGRGAAAGGRGGSRGRRPAGVSPSLTPPSRWSSADGAGFLLGLFLYALVLNTIRYGPAGPRAWLAAKFLNKPDTSLVAA